MSEEPVGLISEISGYIKLLVPADVKIVDVGKIDLKEGASSKKLEVKIREIEEVYGKTWFLLEIQVRKSALISIEFVDDAGDPVLISQKSESWYGPYTEIRYEMPEGTDMNFVHPVVKYRPTAEAQIPFVVHDLIIPALPIVAP